MTKNQTNPQSLAEATATVMYAQDRASQELGMTLETIKPGYAKLRMQVRENMLNGHHICHGGFIFTLADSAFAFACNSYNQVTVAARASIDFLAPAQAGDELIAVAEERALSGRTGIYDITVNNQNGVCIALFRGNSHRIRGEVVPQPHTKEQAS